MKAQNDNTTHSRTTADSAESSHRLLAFEPNDFETRAATVETAPQETLERLSLRHLERISPFNPDYR